MSDVEEDDDEELIGEDPQEEDQPMGSPLVAGGDDDDDDEEAEGGTGEEEEDDPGEDAVYVYYNRQYYRVPKAAGEKAGWVRLYNRSVKVANGKLLGELNAGTASAWEQLVDSVTADKIVVLKGKMKEDDPVLHNVWCLIVEVEGVSGKSDHQIVRHIPRAAFKAIWEQISSDPAMKESSLLKMPPYQDNVKAYNPLANSLVKMVGEAQPKSAMVAVAKAPSKKTAPVDPAEEAQPVKKAKGASGEAVAKGAKKAAEGPSNEGKVAAKKAARR